MKNLAYHKIFLLLIVILELFALGCIQRSLEKCKTYPIEYGQRDQCFRQLAIETKNISVCNFIEDTTMRDYWCYREIAYDTKDRKFCDLINDTIAKQSCYDIVAGKEKFERGR